MRLAIRYIVLAVLSCSVISLFFVIILKSNTSYITTEGYNNSFDHQSNRLASSINNVWDGLKCKVVLTDSEFRANPLIKTENTLIDNYGMNDVTKAGENGRGIIFSAKEKERTKSILAKYKLNTLASDLIPLNRKVPDSRLPR